MSVSQFAPSQQPQHFDENGDSSTNPIYQYNGNLYLFMEDGVGSSASGGGTAQFFIYKSIDDGVTWTDITPAVPQKIGLRFGQLFIRVNNTVYLSNVVGVPSPFRQLNVLGFDLATELWIADGPAILLSSTGMGIADGMQAAVRISDSSIIFACTRTTTAEVVICVYDTVGIAWTVAPTAVGGLTGAQVVSGGCDSTDRAHFFAVAWSGGTLGSGSPTLQHWTVATNNAISNIDLAYTFVNPPDPQFSWNDVGEPVFYLDVVPNTRMISLPIGTRDNQFPYIGNIVGLILLMAAESVVPTWSTVSVPTGENFTSVTLANSQVTAMFVPSLLPIQFSGQTQLHIFWTANGEALASGSNPWDNFLRHLDYTNGVFSGVTTEFSSLGTKIMPGSLYPILLSNSGGVGLVGGFFPTIDLSLFLSQTSKYSALNLWWMAFDAVAPGNPLLVDCGNPPLGQVGVAYTAALSASGGTPPYTFAIIAGGLPPGLSLNAGIGVISGLPTTTGTFAYTAQVTDSAAATASVDCSITIDPGGQTNPAAGGGGTGRKCQTIQCHSRLQNVCVGWGPLTVMQDRVGVRVVYQDTRGDVRTAILPQGVEPFRYIAWMVTKWENAPVGYNNPGNLKARGGMLDKDGQLVAFATLAQGQAALLEMIHLSLEPDGEVM